MPRKKITHEQAIQLNGEQLNPGVYLWKVLGEDRVQVNLSELTSRSREALINVLNLNFLDFDFDRYIFIAKSITRNVEEGTELEYREIDTAGDTKIHLRMCIETLRMLDQIEDGITIIAKKVRGKVVLNVAEKTQEIDETI